MSYKSPIKIGIGKIAAYMGILFVIVQEEGSFIPKYLYLKYL
jgi:hypothetical protein